MGWLAVVPAEPTRHPNQFAFSCLLFKPVGAALTGPWGADCVHNPFSLGRLA
jgi:hypothetical protein